MLQDRDQYQVVSALNQTFGVSGISRRRFLGGMMLFVTWAT